MAETPAYRSAGKAVRRTRLMPGIQDENLGQNPADRAGFDIGLRGSRPPLRRLFQ